MIRIRLTYPDRRGNAEPRMSGPTPSGGERAGDWLRMSMWIGGVPVFFYACLLATFARSGFPPGLAAQGWLPWLADKPVGEDGFYLLTVAWHIASGHQHSAARHCRSRRRRLADPLPGRRQVGLCEDRDRDRRAHDRAPVVSAWAVGSAARARG